MTQNSPSPPYPLANHLDKGWLKVNFDTGAAASVMPQQWAVAQASAGTQKFRASGQELEDAGGIKLRGKAESGKFNMS
eukprot:422258-Amphidinium_carterae.2